MEEHPIEGLMTTAMNNIKDMIDVNTIIGEPIETSNNIVIIPISKVSFGFAAGGSEFNGETINEYKKVEKEEQIQYRLPFGGGSGAGVTINPIAFLVIQPENVKLIPVNHTSSLDKLLDFMPDLIEKTNAMITKILSSNKNEESEKVLKQEKKENEAHKVKKYDNTVEINKIQIKKDNKKDNKNYESDTEYEYNDMQNDNDKVYPEDD